MILFYKIIRISLIAFGPYNSSNNSYTCVESYDIYSKDDELFANINAVVTASINQHVTLQFDGIQYAIHGRSEFT